MNAAKIQESELLFLVFPAFPFNKQEKQERTGMIKSGRRLQVAPHYAEAWCNLGVVHKNQVTHPSRGAESPSCDLVPEHAAESGRTACTWE